MATNTRKTNNARTTAASKKIEAVESKPVEEKKVSFNATDLIPCVSMTVGELIMVGIKSGNVYDFVDFGDVVEVEYRDLDSAVRTRSHYIFDPKIVVQNIDFLKMHKNVDEVYNGLYSPSDLVGLLDYPPDKLKAIVKALPIGTQEALKGIVMQRIQDGRLDSVNRVKALDEVFGTKMAIKMSI